MISEEKIREEKRGDDNQQENRSGGHKKRQREEETLSVTLHCRETRRQYDSSTIILRAMSFRCLVGCWLRSSDGAELSHARVWCSGACICASSETGMWRSGEIRVACGSKKGDVRVIIL